MSKRAGNRRRAAAPPTPQAKDPRAPELHITVAAITDLHELDLRHETELVKAALLYADRVTLASPKVAFMASLASITTLDDRQRIKAMAELGGLMNNGQEGAKLYAELSQRRRRLSPRERTLLARLEHRLHASSQGLIDKVEELLDDAGAGELAQALETGVLDLDGLGIDEADETNFTDTIIGRLADVLAESVSATAHTFPLFDNDAGNLMRAMVAEGKVADVHVARSNEAAAAGRLIADLDAFPRAAMDELLDVRRELEQPLVRFRAALATLTAQFEAAAWEEGFEREVEDLYRQQVAPALLEVQQALEELGALPTLLRLTSNERVAAAAAGLGLAAAAAVGYADLPTVIYGTSSAPLLAAGANEAAHRRDVKHSTAQNSFYFLYAAGRRLA
jgi:hypothetical protein